MRNNVLYTYNALGLFMCRVCVYRCMVVFILQQRVLAFINHMLLLSKELSGQKNLLGRREKESWMDEMGYAANSKDFF